MKLYRSLGRIWTGTQADAKKAQDGKDFEEIDVPTDKPGLMAWLNTFDVRPGDVPPVVTIPTMAEMGIDADELDEMLGGPGGGEIIHVTPVHGPGGAPICVACARDAKAAGMIANASSVICARADIESVTEIESVDDLIARLQRRRAALETVTVIVGDPEDEMLG